MTRLEMFYNHDHIRAISYRVHSYVCLRDTEGLKHIRLIEFLRTSLLLPGIGLLEDVSIAD